MIKQKSRLIFGIVAVLILVLAALLISLFQQAQRSKIPADKYCEKDADCACGVHIESGNCFYGNKNYVNVMQQCPDFCTGIHGRFVIKCIDNECKQVFGKIA